ncbi:hypothetical protein SCLCIDRAFT_1038520 [Scleroderma citrinum Foug A]|uniref:Uncharacterized protein n=1 Tax=Scleroderma citrinum Foug A TaxID=1036808 RepID=A0A0C3DSD2_9AGAM|nr:hypothetical protein SCLCIDRAFT_1038520 [Scleroderma citrinum Foug A]
MSDCITVCLEGELNGITWEALGGSWYVYPLSYLRAPVLPATRVLASSFPYVPHEDFAYIPFQTVSIWAEPPFIQINTKCYVYCRTGNES